MRRLSITTLALAVASTSALALTVSNVTWSGKISATDEAKLSGNASMKATADEKGTEVSVMLMGDANGTTRPWHIHTGSCATGGPIFGDAKAYTPLTTSSSGHATASATLAVAVPDTGSYFVNIHESTGNLGKIVACGDLTKQKM
ncbi:MAG: hypothetical protein IT359_13400 [Gemmatimonadaceae bacterium]|nr:hypothetical protein [Gemmatimonadaceae bacterium]